MPSRFPSTAEEAIVHERVLSGDPVAPVTMYERFMDPLIAALRHDLRCTDDQAYDSAVDAILIYLDNASTYDRSKGRLSTYLVGIAKNKAIDRLRARIAEKKREVAFAEVVELWTPAPQDEMEVAVQAKEIWAKVEQELPLERDREALRMILAGERSTAALAETLGISADDNDKELQVKRHRDRLLKTLERLGKRLEQ